MALAIALKDLPGYKTAKAIYNKIPGRGIVQKALVVVGIGAVIVGAIALGWVGIPALLSLGAAFLTLPLIVQVGIITALPVVYSLFVRGIQYIWNFNWKISDKEINEQIENNVKALYGMTGSAVGSALGYLVCGALPGALAFAFNPAVAAVVLKDVNEEAKDEVYGQLAAIAHGTLALLVNAMVLKGFQGTRKWIKRPGTPFHNFFKELLGKDFENWGKEGQPSFSFAQKVEERVENIKDERLRNFTEEFLESFSDSCIEAGYIVVNSMSSQMASQRLMQQQQEDSQQTVIIDFSPT